MRRAAERFQGAVTTAKRWAERYHQQDEADMVGRSSHPHRSPALTDTNAEACLLIPRR